MWKLTWIWYFRSTKNQFGGIAVRVAGVEILNDDPSEVSVLYGKIDSDSLQPIADGIMEYFIARGLSQWEPIARTFHALKTFVFIIVGLARREFDRDSVKMHMTLINTKYSNKNEADGDDTATKHRQQKVKAYFDARTIIERYGKYDFGSQSIDEIHLCQIHSVACDGFYQTTTSIKF